MHFGYVDFVVSIWMGFPNVSPGHVIMLMFSMHQNLQIQRVQRRMVLVVIFFVFWKLFICFVVAIFDLVHDMEAIHDLC